jgi:hypothetical protein
MRQAVIGAGNVCGEGGGGEKFGARKKVISRPIEFSGF